MVFTWWKSIHFQFRKEGMRFIHKRYNDFLTAAAFLSVLLMMRKFCSMQLIDKSEGYTDNVSSWRN